MATMMAYIFGVKHDIHKQQVRCKLQGVSYIVPKRHELWSTNGFKLERLFYKFWSFFFYVRLQLRLPITWQIRHRRAMFLRVLLQLHLAWHDGCATSCAAKLRNNSLVCHQPKGHSAQNKY